MPVNYQTVRLARGKHSSPANGACIMELASMLAGEPFSDHPDSVCPVIAALMRRYNDAADDERRQDLKAYAVRVIGSRSDPETELMRLRHLREWAVALQSTRSRWARLMDPFNPELVETSRIVEGTHNVELMARYIVAMLRRPTKSTHQKVLALLDELLAMNAHSAGATETHTDARYGSTETELTVAPPCA